VPVAATDAGRAHLDDHAVRLRRRVGSLFYAERCAERPQYCRFQLGALMPGRVTYVTLDRLSV
jgi:hypothetical protein